MVLAARWWGRRDVRIEELDDPGSPRAGWVRLRVEACGICGTDLEEYTAGPNVIPTKPHPLSGAAAPLTLGHEAVGLVEEAGPGVTLAPGTRVAVEANMFCGDCWYCERREYHLCAAGASLGLMADGGLAEVLMAPAGMCSPVGEHVAPDHGALAEPLAVAVRAVRRGGVTLGSTVAVLGCGTVGLLVAQVARLAGARTIVAIDRLPQRRELAVALGSDAAVAPDEATPATRDLTTGVGPDVVIEAAGNPAAATAAVQLVRKGGRAVLLGVFDGHAPIDMMDLLLGEKEVVASFSHLYDDDFTTAVSLINRGVVAIEPLISDRVSLADVVERGFNALISDPAAHCKIIVTPNR